MSEHELDLIRSNGCYNKWLNVIFSNVLTDNNVVVELEFMKMIRTFYNE